MIQELPVATIPEWLKSIGVGEIPESLPLQDILTDSLYYPACRFDPRPIKNLNGNVVSFVYADYLVKREEFLTEIKERSFLGYDCIHQCDVSQRELAPFGWTPKISPTHRIESLKYWQNVAQPFAHWSVWRLQDGYDANHGAELFSLLYIAGEMSATYQGLYYQHNVLPKILALIWPGSFGGEWEYACSDDSFFHKVVVSHPKGVPPFFITDHNSETGSCFSEYQGKPLAWIAGNRLYSRS